MKQLIDFIPLVIFFALYKTHDIYMATGALIVATLIQLLVTWIMYKKIEKMQLITTCLVISFGGMTLFFQDDNFIKWKVTIVYAIFAIGLMVSHFLGKPLIKGMLGKEISLPDGVWTNINHAWVLFFTLLAGVNIYVAYRMPLDFWVNFKVFGLLTLTLVYTVVTGLYIYKYLPKNNDIE